MTGPDWPVRSLYLDGTRCAIPAPEADQAIFWSKSTFGARLGPIGTNPGHLVYSSVDVWVIR